MLDLIFSFLATLVAGAIEAAINFLMPIFGFDFATFNNAFPFAAQAYLIFQRVALGIALLISAWQLLPFLTGRMDKIRTTPIRAAMQAVLSVGGIYYLNYILTAIIEIAQYPFDALLDTTATEWSSFAFSPIMAVITDLFYQGSILLYIIMLVLIGWSLIKLILEAVERYVVLFILVYLSPLASAALASENTLGIFKRYFTMFISQCILLLLNVWSLKMSVSMLSSLGNNATPALGLVLGYAFLRLALKMDSYLNQLGLNAAVTGSGLGTELLATGAMVAGQLSGNSTFKSFGGGSNTNGSGSPILGAGQRIASFVPNFSPVSAAGDTLRDFGKVIRSNPGKAGDLADGISGGMDAARAAFSQTNGSFFDRTRAGAAAGWKETRDSLNQTLSETQNGASIFAASNSPLSRAIVSEYAADAQAHMSSSTDVCSSEELSGFARSSRMADKAFTSFHENQYSTDEAADVAAVMQGLGIERVSKEGQQFTDVGYGNIGADQILYNMNKDGISANFTRNGYDEEMSIVNRQQYNALDPQKQHGYEKFKTDGGQTYYYRYNRTKQPPVTKPGKNGAGS